MKFQKKPGFGPDPGSPKNNRKAAKKSTPKKSVKKNTPKKTVRKKS